MGYRVNFGPSEIVNDEALITATDICLPVPLVTQNHGTTYVGTGKPWCSSHDTLTIYVVMFT